MITVCTVVGRILCVSVSEAWHGIFHEETVLEYMM